MSISSVSGVSLVGVSLMSADMAIVVVRLELVFVCRSRTRACWNRSEHAVTMVLSAQKWQN
jgi:hypothetical protein